MPVEIATSSPPQARRRCPIPGGDRCALGGACLLDDHRELIAPLAKDEVLAANHPLEAGADLDQEAIAGEVPVGLVDLLEAIEVDHDQTELTAVAGDLLGQPLLEVTVVADPGQRVAPGEGPELMAAGLQALGEEHRRAAGERQAERLDPHHQGKLAGAEGSKEKGTEDRHRQGEQAGREIDAAKRGE